MVAQSMALSALKYLVSVPSPISLMSFPSFFSKRGSRSSRFFLIRAKALSSSFALNCLPAEDFPSISEENFKHNFNI